MRSSYGVVFLIFCLTLALLGALVLFKLLAPGPTPYPSTKNITAWPGAGPVRFFGAMNDQRKEFWSQREKDQGKVVFVGDSIIHGWKLNRDFPGKPVANRGVDGDVTRGLLFRFQEDVLDLHPKAIVLEIGSNDLAQGGTIPEIVANYTALLDRAQKARPEIPVIILSLIPQMNPANVLYPRLNTELARLAATRRNVIFVDVYSALLNPEGMQDVSLFNVDGVHPTDAGHSRMAKPVARALTDRNMF